MQPEGSRRPEAGVGGLDPGASNPRSASPAQAESNLTPPLDSLGDLFEREREFQPGAPGVATGDGDAAGDTASSQPASGATLPLSLGGPTDDSDAATGELPAPDPGAWGDEVARLSRGLSGFQSSWLDPTVSSLERAARAAAERLAEAAERLAGAAGDAGGLFGSVHEARLAVDKERGRLEDLRDCLGRLAGTAGNATEGGANCLEAAASEEAFEGGLRGLERQLASLAERVAAAKLPPERAARLSESVGDARRAVAGTLGRWRPDAVGSPEVVTEGMLAVEALRRRLKGGDAWKGKAEAEAALAGASSDLDAVARQSFRWERRPQGSSLSLRGDMTSILAEMVLACSQKEMLARRLQGM